MVIVYKDFLKNFSRIEAVPLDGLGTIKRGLNSVSIHYYESKTNLNWKQVLKAVMNDPKYFTDNGGWDFLTLKVTESEKSGNFTQFEPESSEVVEKEKCFAENSW